MKVAIIDYGAGNTQSVKYALNRLGWKGFLTSDIEEIKKCMKEYDKSFDEIFITKSMNHPYILKLSLSKRISLETFAVLDMILNFIPQIDKYLKDPIWKDYKKLVLNYKPFLEVDTTKMRKLIKDVLMKG